MLQFALFFLGFLLWDSVGGFTTGGMRSDEPEEYEPSNNLYITNISPDVRF